MKAFYHLQCHLKNKVGVHKLFLSNHFQEKLAIKGNELNSVNIISLQRAIKDYLHRHTKNTSTACLIRIEYPSRHIHGLILKEC